MSEIRPDGIRHSVLQSKHQPYHQRPLGYDYADNNNNNNNASTYSIGEEKEAEPSLLQDSNARFSIAASTTSGDAAKTAGYKTFRQDEHAREFTKGGRGRTCGRCCLCTTFTGILVIIGIVAGFLLWVRPPNVEFMGLEPPADGAIVKTIDDGFCFDFILNFNVTNPNFFGAKFQKISATASLPVNKSQSLGGGSLSNVHIKAHSVNQIAFPFTLNYTEAIDPQRTIISDLLVKCGFTGAAASKITVDYDLTLKFKLVLVTISPTISSSTAFDCPLNDSSLSGMGGSLQSTIAGLLGGSGGNLRRYVERTKRGF